MKKFLSILLAAVMLLALTVPAFAADDTVSLNETKSFSLNYSDITVFSFTPEEAGVYLLELNMTGYQLLNINIESESSTALEYSVYGYFFDDFYSEQTIFCAGGGTEYKITFTLEEIYEELSEKTEIEFTVSQYDAKEIKPGENKTTQSDDMFFFSPDKSGFYTFVSDASPELFCYLIIYDSYGYSDYYGADSEDDRGFSCTKYFHAGEIYAMSVETYNGIEYEEYNEPVSFTVSYSEKPAIDSMEIYGYVHNFYPVSFSDGDTLELINKQGYEFMLYGSPAVIQYLNSFSVASGDESKLTALYNEEEQVFYLSTKKAGKTTLTITADDGTVLHFNVKIKCMFVAVIEAFFEELSSTICSWLAGIFS